MGWEAEGEVSDGYFAKAARHLINDLQQGSAAKSAVRTRSASQQKRTPARRRAIKWGLGEKCRVARAYSLAASDAALSPSTRAVSRDVWREK